MFSDGTIPFTDASNFDSRIGEWNLDQVRQKTLIPHPGRRILFIDTLHHDPSVIESVEQLGLEITVVDTMEEACMLDQSQTGYFDTVLVDQLSIVERLRDVEHLRYIPLVLITPQIPQLNLKVSLSRVVLGNPADLQSSPFSTASISVLPIASNHQQMLKTCATRYFPLSKQVIGYLQKEAEMLLSRFFSQRIVGHAHSECFSLYRAHLVSHICRHRQSKGCPQIPRKCWSSNRGRREWSSRA